jgi:hypothetical protein
MHGYLWLASLVNPFFSRYETGYYSPTVSGELLVQWECHKHVLVSCAVGDEDTNEPSVIVQPAQNRDAMVLIKLLHCAGTTVSPRHPLFLCAP